MSTLAELGEEYLAASVRLRLGIERLEARLATLERTEERLALEHDLRLLWQMQRETREVGEFVRHYYERGYYRNRKYTL